MITSVDYLIIAFYLGFMVVVGLVFRRFNRNISDYFCGGGAMLWWMSGASAMMSALSAWSFTGAAGAIYETGALVGMIYFSNALSLVFVYCFTCRKFRRMRVVTYAEAVRRRFGGTTEQFYVWVQLPTSLVGAGLALNALGVFMSATFQTEVVPTILGVGGVVIVVAMLGGAWAVVAGDFLQLLLMLLVLGLAAFFALRLPEIGGISGLIAKVPASHFHWTRLMRADVLGLWCAAIFLNSFFNFNNMAEGAARFLTVKDGRHARKAALAMIGCFLVIPVILMIPPMAAAVVFPDLHAQFPRLKNPAEAAFVAICLKSMPPGMVGLLVAGIFATAMASMDTGLNRNSGIFIRNVYQRFLRPQAAERELLLASKGATVAFGLLIVGIASFVSAFRSLDLFNLILAFSSLVSIPLMVPMLFGMFVRHAPTWAGWSTALVGIAAAWVARYGVGPGRVARWLDLAALTPRESQALALAATVLFSIAAGALWFFGATFLARREMPAHVTEFFEDLSRPVDAVAERIVYDDRRQYLTMGTLCLAYGLGVALFALLPNETAGHLALFGCGGGIMAIGGTLRFAGRRREFTP